METFIQSDDEIDDLFGDEEEQEGDNGEAVAAAEAPAVTASADTEEDEDIFADDEPDETAEVTTTSANAIAGASTCASESVPLPNAATVSHQPAAAPGTVTQCALSGGRDTG